MEYDLMEKKMLEWGVIIIFESVENERYKMNVTSKYTFVSD